jgi:hypothetical protein
MAYAMTIIFQQTREQALQEAVKALKTQMQRLETDKPCLDATATCNKVMSSQVPRNEHMRTIKDTLQLRKPSTFIICFAKKMFTEDNTATCTT